MTTNRSRVLFRWTLIGLALCAVGVFLGVVSGAHLVVAGMCDSSCPSDHAVAVYTVLFWVSATIAAVGLVITIVSTIRRNRAWVPPSAGEH